MSKDLGRIIGALSPKHRDVVLTRAGKWDRREIEGPLDMLATAIQREHFDRIVARNQGGFESTPSKLADRRKATALATLQAFGLGDMAKLRLHEIDFWFEDGTGDYTYALSYSSMRRHHRVRLPPTWTYQVRDIGDGSGLIADGVMVLSARRDFHDNIAERSFWRARIARRIRRNGVRCEDVVLSGWPHGIVTVHKNVQSAMREDPPQAVLDRTLTREDVAALRGIEF